MNFDLTEEQRQSARRCTDFAEREIKPHSTRWDKEETFPRQIVEQLGQLGFLGVAFPEKFGGGGADTLSQVLVVEGLSRYDASIGLTCAAHMSLSTGHIAGFASDEQRDSLRARHAAGEEARRMVPDRSRAPVPTPPRCIRRRRASATTIRSTAPRCSSPTARVADVYVVMAMTDQARGRDGVSAFIVDRGTSRDSRNGQQNREARTARVRHRRSDFRKRHGAGAQPDRRARRGLSADAQGARRRANRNRRLRGGNRARRIRGSARLRATSAGSSARRLPISRRSSGCSPTWRRESTRRGC